MVYVGHYTLFYTYEVQQTELLLLSVQQNTLAKRPPTPPADMPPPLYVMSVKFNSIAVHFLSHLSIAIYVCNAALSPRLAGAVTP